MIKVSSEIYNDLIKNIFYNFFIRIFPNGMVSNEFSKYEKLIFFIINNNIDGVCFELGPLGDELIRRAFLQGIIKNHVYQNHLNKKIDSIDMFV